jgi:hypothetical protein
MTPMHSTRPGLNEKEGMSTSGRRELRAHVIPKRAFSDPQEAESFFRLARSRKEAAG